MPATVSITYLDKELISSGTFHTLGPGTTKLRFSYGDEHLSIDFIVSEDEGKEMNQMWAQVVDPDLLQVHLINFRQLLPAQVLGPFEPGTIANRPLTMIFEVTGVKNNPCKYVSYSLYLGGVNG